MGDKKNDVAKDHEKEKNKFIREQIKKKPKKVARHYIRKCGTWFGMLIMFCSISVATYFLMNKYFVKDSAGPAVSLQMDEDHSGKKGGETVSYGNYASWNQKMAKVGSGMNGALVAIRGEVRDERWNIYGESIFSGAIIQETKQFYYVLTSYAVSSLGEKLQIRLGDGKVVDGSMISSDKSTGIGICAIPKNEISKESDALLQIASLDDDRINIGSTVIAVGMPNGVIGSVHPGVVTNNNVEIPTEDMNLNGYLTDITGDSHGSGFVLNESGEIIGIIGSDFSAYLGDNATGFVDIASLTQNINQLLKGQSIPRLGIQGVTVDSTNEKEAGVSNGVHLVEVLSGSAAYESGLRAADVITEVDGKTIGSMNELHELLLRHQSGDEVSITVMRHSGDQMHSKIFSVLLG